jgi:chemotaxis protein MotB
MPARARARRHGKRREAMRKKKHPEHVNHERWLVSYADFITLLFAFFVVMFAVSQVDSKKLGRFTESFSRAVGVDLFPLAGHGIMEGNDDGAPAAAAEAPKSSTLPEELNGLKSALLSAAEKDSSMQNVEIVARRNELVLRLSDTLLFDSGDDALKEPAVRVVAHIARELLPRHVDVRVEGHTDDRPIRTARFRSNWDLSTSRATAVVARLAAEGVAAPRLSAAGYGEFHPIVSNATDDGRKLNRRVDLVVSLQPKDAP